MRLKALSSRRIKADIQPTLAIPIDSNPAANDCCVDWLDLDAGEISPWSSGVEDDRDRDSDFQPDPDDPAFRSGAQARPSTRPRRTLCNKKLLISMVLENKVGALLKALKVYEEHVLNITSISSEPSGWQPESYLTVSTRVEAPGATDIPKVHHCLRAVSLQPEIGIDLTGASGAGEESCAGGRSSGASKDQVKSRKIPRSVKTGSGDLRKTRSGFTKGKDAGRNNLMKKKPKVRISWNRGKSSRSFKIAHDSLTDNSAPYDLASSDDGCDSLPPHEDIYFGDPEVDSDTGPFNAFTPAISSTSDVDGVLGSTNTDFRRSDCAVAVDSSLKRPKRSCRQSSMISNIQLAGSMNSALDWTGTELEDIDQLWSLKSNSPGKSRRGRPRKSLTASINTLSSEGSSRKRRRKRGRPRKSDLQTVPIISDSEFDDPDFNGTSRKLSKKTGILQSNAQCVRQLNIDLTNSDGNSCIFEAVDKGIMRLMEDILVTVEKTESNRYAAHLDFGKKLLLLQHNDNCNDSWNRDCLFHFFDQDVTVSTDFEFPRSYVDIGGCSSEILGKPYYSSVFPLLATLTDVPAKTKPSDIDSSQFILMTEVEVLLASMIDLVDLRSPFRSQDILCSNPCNVQDANFNASAGNAKICGLDPDNKDVVETLVMVIEEVIMYTDNEVLAMFRLLESPGGAIKKRSPCRQQAASHNRKASSLDYNISPANLVSSTERRRTRASAKAMMDNSDHRPSPSLLEPLNAGAILDDENGTLSPLSETLEALDDIEDFLPLSKLQTLNPSTNQATSNRRKRGRPKKHSVSYDDEKDVDYVEKSESVKKSGSVPKRSKVARKKCVGARSRVNSVNETSGMIEQASRGLLDDLVTAIEDGKTLEWLLIEGSKRRLRRPQRTRATQPSRIQLFPRAGGPPARIKCPKCDFIGYREQVKGHISIRHSTAPPSSFTCSECTKDFPDADSLESHLALHSYSTNPADLTCQICGRVFESQSSLIIHNSSECDSGTEISRLINEKGGIIGLPTRRTTKSNRDANPNNTVENGSKTTAKKVKCPHCDFIAPPELVHAHVVSKHANMVSGNKLKNPPKVSPGTSKSGTKPKLGVPKPVVVPPLGEKGEFPCEVCGKPFEYKVLAVGHVNTHNPQQTVFPCSFCGKEFGSLSNVQGHENAIHLRLRQNLCKFCGKIFSELSGLTNHIQQHHPKESIDPDSFPIKYHEIPRKSKPIKPPKPVKKPKPPADPLAPKPKRKRMSKSKKPLKPGQNPGELEMDEDYAAFLGLPPDVIAAFEGLEQTMQPRSAGHSVSATVASSSNAMPNYSQVQSFVDQVMGPTRSNPANMGSFSHSAPNSHSLSNAVLMAQDAVDGVIQDLTFLEVPNYGEDGGANQLLYQELHPHHQSSHQQLQQQQSTSIFQDVALVQDEPFGGIQHQSSRSSSILHVGDKRRVHHGHGASSVEQMQLLPGGRGSDDYMPQGVEHLSVCSNVMQPPCSIAVAATQPSTHRQNYAIINYDNQPDVVVQGFRNVNSRNNNIGFISNDKGVASYSVTANTPICSGEANSRLPSGAPPHSSGKRIANRIAAATSPRLSRQVGRVSGNPVSTRPMSGKHLGALIGGTTQHGISAAAGLPNSGSSEGGRRVANESMGVIRAGNMMGNDNKLHRHQAVVPSSGGSVVNPFTINQLASMVTPSQSGHLVVPTRLALAATAVDHEAINPNQDDRNILNFQSVSTINNHSPNVASTIFTAPNLNWMTAGGFDLRTMQLAASAHNLSTAQQQQQQLQLQQQLQQMQFEQQQQQAQNRQQQHLGMSGNNFGKYH